MRKPRQLKDADLLHQVEKLLSRHPKTRFTAEQISRKINVSNPIDAIKRVLQKLASEKKMVMLSEDRFKWMVQGDGGSLSRKPRGEDEILFTGVVDMTRSGAAYIVSPESVEDIYVHSRNLKGAMHKDEVVVSVTESRSRRRPEGRVVSIEKRALSRLIGHIRIFKNYAILTPDNSTIFPEVLVHHDDCLQCADNNRVVVEITSWGRGQNKAIWGKVIKVLEDISEIEMHMQSILYANGFDVDFPEVALHELSRIEMHITPEEVQRRRDFRGVTTFTIDPLTARDFDDALSLQTLENGQVEIGIHIADVTHYLQEGSILDKEAFKRSTSVYLVDRVCPMLPEKLSNDLCSLNPHEDKLTFSAVFRIDGELNILHEWYGKTIIHSDRRFTYEEAQERIESTIGDFAQEINVLNGIARKLRQSRFLQGSINFESDEVQFILDEDSNPTGMYVRERKEAHMMIEEFMLLANKMVATYIAGKPAPEVPFIYRVHDLPNPDKLHDFALFASELGFKFRHDTPDQIADSFNRLAVAVSEDPVLKLLEPLAIRTMAKAVYAAKNIGHYGLGFEYYTHFTSPIRRYSDVIAHRILFKNLEHDFRTDKINLEVQAKYVSEQEKKATLSERESVKYFQTLFISKFIGQEFKGVISGIIEKGIFVELSESKVEGLVTFDSMGDVFMVPTSRLKAYSKISGTTFRIGQDVKVVIISADPESRRTDMELVLD